MAEGFTFKKKKQKKTRHTKEKGFRFESHNNDIRRVRVLGSGLTIAYEKEKS